MRITFDPTRGSPRKMHIQLARFLAAEVAAGRYPSRLPGEYRIATDHDVPLAVAQKAMQVLREHGIVTTTLDHDVVTSDRQAVRRLLHT